MDVPSWHPANQDADALRRLATSGAEAPKRTEFKIVKTSTEEERQQLDNEENVALGGGRGLLDPSDRLYLLEQTQLELQANSKEQLEKDAALQTFRSNALKMHAHKPSVPEISVAITGKRVPEKKAVVVIRAKRRRMPTDNEAKLKKSNKTPKTSSGRTSEVKEGDKKKEAASETKAEESKSSAMALLLQDYSSSSDDE